MRQTDHDPHVPCSQVAAAVKQRSSWVGFECKRFAEPRYPIRGSSAVIVDPSRLLPIGDPLRKRNRPADGELGTDLFFTLTSLRYKGRARVNRRTG